MKLHAMGKKHAAILDALTQGLDDVHNHRKIDNGGEGVMPAVIEKIGPCRFSVAHYFEAGGDLVADPDLEFVKQLGGWYPVAITQWCGYQRVAQTDHRGRIVGYDWRAYVDLRSFAGTMLDNIQEQQGDLSPGTTPSEERDDS